MSHSTVGEVVPLNLEFPKHFLELLQYKHDLFSYAGHLQVIDVLGHSCHYLRPAGYRSVFHAQFTVNGAGLQAAQLARDLCKFEREKHLGASLHPVPGFSQWSTSVPGSKTS